MDWSQEGKDDKGKEERKKGPDKKEKFVRGASVPGGSSLLFMRNRRDRRTEGQKDDARDFEASASGFQRVSISSSGDSGARTSALASQAPEEDNGGGKRKAELERAWFAGPLPAER